MRISTRNKTNLPEKALLNSSESYRNTSHAQNQRRCIYCGQLAPLVWVHGHGQCASCGINVEECCRGENCDFD